MQFSALTPSLLVDDIHETVEYYQTHFGFETLQALPNASEAMECALMKRNSVVLMFQCKANLKSKLANRVSSTTGAGISLMIEVDDAGELFDSVLDKVELVTELEESTAGGLEFSVLDPNGYLITFTETQER